MKKIILFLCSIIAGAVANAAAPSFLGSIPENGATVSSFNEIKLNFDLSEVEAEYGNPGQWGMSYNAMWFEGFEDFFPPQMAVLYKGSVEDNNIVGRIYDSYTASSQDWSVKDYISLSFPNINIEENQLYTLVVTFEFFSYNPIAEQKSTYFDCTNSPLKLEFIGGEGGDKALILESSTLSEDAIFEKVPEISLYFNYDVDVLNGNSAYILEDNNLFSESITFSKNYDNSKSILLTSPDKEIYFGHTYDLIIPKGAIGLSENHNITNDEIKLTFNGNSFHYFGTGRIRPSNGSVTVLGEITIPFKFPEVEGKNYGFIALSNGDQTPFTGYLYEGDDDSTEPIEIMIGGVTSDSKGLIFNPTIIPNPESSYTIVIPEGNVKAYEIGASREIYLKDYLSERVELHYTTPAVSDLPLWQPTAANISEGAEIEHLDYFIVNCPDYEYDGVIYNTISAKLFREGGKLYEVTADGDKEIASFNITRPTLTAESEIGNGQYIGKYFVGKVDQDLYIGKTYKLVLLSGEFVVDNPFIGHYIGNEEVSVTIKGAASTELKSEFTSNIAEGQTASHLGVVSIYTNDPVAVVEGAALELRNGENVKTAPVRVATEEGYSHIYADFSDADHKALALDRATEYTVVLPQGSLTHTENENLVNNEYSFSVNGLEKEVEPIVPEYVSVDFMIDNYVSTSYRMVKGEPSTIKVNSTDEWYLKSLTLNGEDVIENVSEEGFYTLPALEADAELAAEFSYFEDLEMTELSGIGSIENGNRNVSVYNDGSVIVIENLEAGDNVAVYTVNGMVIKSFVASKDVMYIDAPVGQVYIIRVNNGAVKLQH